MVRQRACYGGGGLVMGALVPVMGGVGSLTSFATRRHSTHRPGQEAGAAAAFAAADNESFRPAKKRRADAPSGPEEAGVGGISPIDGGSEEAGSGDSSSDSR